MHFSVLSVASCEKPASFLPSMSSDAESAVRHNAPASRFEITAAGATAVAEYRDEGGRRVFHHTFVPPALRGKGLAEKLVRHALSDARAKNLRVLPACSYVAAFIEKNPEFQYIVS
jgi:predicted GNAT family acetyltransferase